MKDFFPVLKILLRFVLIYIGLVLFYQFYLNHYENAVADPFTKSVANQVVSLQNFLGHSTELIDNVKYKTVIYHNIFLTDGKYTARMVEGCNAISVMILFVAFIFAFYKGKKTFLYILGGLVLLHILNVFRIAMLNIISLKFPQYEKIGHDYFFPAIIYGGVIVLWLIWIRVFSLKKKDDA